MAIFRTNDCHAKSVYNSGIYYRVKIINWFANTLVDNRLFTCQRNHILGKNYNLIKLRRAARSPFIMGMGSWTNNAKADIIICISDGIGEKSQYSTWVSIPLAEVHGEHTGEE